MVMMSSAKFIIYAEKGMKGLLMHNRQAMLLGAEYAKAHPRDKVASAAVEALWGRYLAESDSLESLKRPGGELAILAEHLQGALLLAAGDGAFSVKVGRVTRTIKRDVAGALFVRPDRLALVRDGRPIADYTLDVRPARIGSARVMRSRPLVEAPWEAELTVDWEADAFLSDFGMTDNPSGLLNLLSFAGRKYGLMDNRPGAPHPGPYGRFLVRRAEAAVKGRKK